MSDQARTVLWRRLNATDVEALQALYTACADFSLQMSGDLSPPNAAAQDLNGIDPQTQLYGCFEGVDLEAMLECRMHYPETGVCFIGVLQVRPASRNKGLGARFFRELQHHWGNEGVKELRLCVLNESAAAQRFWQRQGFLRCADLPPTRFGMKEHVRHEFRYRYTTK